MLLKATCTHNLNKKTCVVIGDRWSDMLAAHQEGMQAILVKTGVGDEALGKYHRKSVAVDWLLRNN